MSAAVSGVSFMVVFNENRILDNKLHKNDVFECFFKFNSTITLMFFRLSHILHVFSLSFQQSVAISSYNWTNSTNTLVKHVSTQHFDKNV